MQFHEGVELGAEAPPVVLAGAVIPQYVFSRRFDNYLFFDVDIRSNGAQISAIQLITRACFGFEHKIKLYSSSDRQLLGCLSSDDDWPVKVGEIDKSLSSSDDYGGLIFVGESGKWAVYQDRPIDVGVFAFDGDKNILSLTEVVEDYFLTAKKFSAGYLRKLSAILA